MSKATAASAYTRAELLSYILQDNPVRSEQDRLGAKVVVGTIEELLQLLCRERLFAGNIALYAPWGSGKTSVLSMLTDKLRPSFLVAWFDAWQYDHKPVHLPLGLLRKIQKALGVEDDENAPFTAYLRSFMRMSSSAATLMSRAIESPEALDDYALWIDQIDSFRAEFQQALGTALQGRHLVVMIDDLDRCGPENVVLVLETIKNFLSVEGVVFLVAIDREVVRETVDSAYRYRQNFGSQYLEKVFPFEFTFHYHEERYHELIDAALREFTPQGVGRTRLEDVFRILPYNPRRLKAILRKLFIQNQYYRGDQDDYDRFLAIVLATYFPDFYHALCTVDERTALNLLEALIIFRELSEGLFRPQQREQQLSKYPGMARFFNDDALLDVVRLMDQNWRFREPVWSLRIRKNERPLRHILDSVALE